MAKERGLLQRATPAEYTRQRRERERADDLAGRLYQQVKTQRFELLDELHMLNRLESSANDAGPDAENAWDELTEVYSKRGPILAELAILENCGAAHVIRFLAADTEAHRRAVAQVISRGGIHDASGRFVEVTVEQ